MTDLQQTYYRRVKNPNPVFTPREGAGTLKFCEKLMEKAVGFTSRFDFAIHVAHARSKGLRRRMPPVLRRRAIDALLQGLCFHYDPLANRVQCSITTLAIECGLATESGAGKLSITRATRALTFLSELGLITYQTEYDPLIGCYIPTDITFIICTVCCPRCIRGGSGRRAPQPCGMGKQTAQKQGLDTPGMDELIAKARRFVRERFRSYQTELKSRGIKRARARRDANRERQDIVTPVKRQLTREISEGLHCQS